MLFPFVFFLSMPGRRGHKRRDSVRSILVVEFWRIGDLVMVTAPIAGLRRRFPDARIDLLASGKAAEILKNNPDISRVIPFDAPWVNRKYGIFRSGFRKIIALLKELRKARYDIAIAYRGDFRDNLFIALTGAARTIGYGFAGGGAFLTDDLELEPGNCHQVDQFLQIDKHLGADITGLRPRLYVDQDEAKEINGILRKYGVSENDFLAVIHPESGSKYRVWSATSFKEVIGHLTKAYSARVAVISGAGSHRVAEEIVSSLGDRNVFLVRDLSLRQLMALYKRSDLAVGVDSGPAHIAGGVGTPTVTIFGPQKSDWFKPYGENCAVVEASVPCSPCRQTVCTTVPTCMERVSPGDVITAIDTILEKTKGTA